MFKIGDKVKLVNPPLRWLSTNLIGQEVEVVRDIIGNDTIEILVLFYGRYIKQVAHISNLEFISSNPIKFKYGI